MDITVKVIGVNRADVFFKQGKYPVFGIELAGVGADGKRYASIIDGGAYSPEAVVEEGSYIEIPSHMSFEGGAASTPPAKTFHFFQILVPR